MKNIVENIKQNYKLIIGVFVIGIFLGWIFFHSSGKSEKMSQNIESHEGHDHDHELEKETTYTCSMHPQIKQNKPGLCPICAMDLIPLSSMQAEGEDVDPNEISMTESAAKLAEIQTMFVTKGQPVKTIYLQGKVQADERNIAELTARFGGRIEKLYINFTGQKVSKGEKLATIYSPELITAQKELIEAISYKESRPSIYNAAKAKLKLWDLSDKQIDAIENNGEPQLYFDILSPISGTISSRHVTFGDYVKEGQALFMVIDLSILWVMFDAYESDLPWIKLNDKVEFNIQSLPGKTFSSNVSYIDPFIDTKTRVAKVRVEIDNPELAIKPEMFTNGTLESEIASNSNVILIPKSALLWTGKRSVVYTKVPDRETPSFLYREIILGPDAGNYYVVEEGLEEGEEIVVNGVFKIDASAQLMGQKSMMNPEGGMVSTGHNHAGLPDGQVDHSEHAQKGPDQAMFEVGGACEMCKDRIEKTALSIKGVSTAKWSTEDHILHLSYDSKKVKLNEVHKTIAAVGHDTELEKAPDEVYNKLPGCCLYDRLSYDKSAQITSEFFVNGACGMCKDRIEETAMSVKGVKSAEWDQDTKNLKLKYSNNLDIIEVHKAIAKVGHDTEKIKAEDEVYNTLPECCLYREL